MTNQPPIRRGFDTFDGLYVGDESNMDSEEEKREDRGEEREGMREGRRERREDRREEREGTREGKEREGRREKWEVRREGKGESWEEVGRRKKWRDRKKKGSRQFGGYFNRTVQEEFDSLAYSSKAVEIIERQDGRPLFLYLSLLTKVPSCEVSTTSPSSPRFILIKVPTSAPLCRPGGYRR